MMVVSWNRTCEHLFCYM